jgi:hypothetical protein
LLPCDDLLLVVQNREKVRQIKRREMTIEFIGHYRIKQWPNWSGEIPQKGDVVLLHFGDNNEEEREYIVQRRIISGTNPDKVIVELECMDR